MKRSTKFAWQRSEEKAAHALGMKRTPASGSRPGYAGDMEGGNQRGEHKYTTKPYFVLRRATLKKIEQEALVAGNTPVLTFEIAGYGQWQVRRLKDSLDHEPFRGYPIQIRGQQRRLASSMLQSCCPLLIILEEFDRWVITQLN